MKIFAIALVAMLLSGCSVPQRPPSISDITPYAVKIQADSRYPVDVAAVQAEAERGCALYNRQARFISQRCILLDELDFCIVQEFLYTCK